MDFLWISYGNQRFLIKSSRFPLEIRGFPLQFDALKINGFQCKSMDFLLKIKGFTLQINGFPIKIKEFLMKLIGFPIKVNGFPTKYIMDFLFKIQGLLLKSQIPGSCRTRRTLRAL